MTSTTTFHLVRQGTAVKLGVHSTGTISYAVLIDTDRTEAFIALTGNAGGGYFSREAVPIAALRRCVCQTDRDKPLGAGAFKPALVGRDTDNDYFAVAALCAEGLLNRVQRESPGRSQPLADAGLWDDWCAQVHAQATEQGEGLPVFQIARPATTEPRADGDTKATATAGVGIKSAAFAETGETGEVAGHPQADETAIAPADADEAAIAPADSDEAGRAGRGEPTAKPRCRGKLKA